MKRKADNIHKNKPNGPLRGASMEKVHFLSNKKQIYARICQQMARRCINYAIRKMNIDHFPVRVFFVIYKIFILVSISSMHNLFIYRTPVGCIWGGVGDGIPRAFRAGLKANKKGPGVRGARAPPRNMFGFGSLSSNLKQNMGGGRRPEPLHVTCLVSNRLETI